MIKNGFIREDGLKRLSVRIVVYLKFTRLIDHYMIYESFFVLPIFGVIQTGAYRGGWHLDISYNERIIYSSYNERIILLVVLLYVVLLYVVPTEYTDYTEAYGLKLFRIHRMAYASRGKNPQK